MTVDDAPWVWADASGEPVVLNGLPPGPHTIRLELETANHQRLDQGAVMFTVPTAPSGASVAARTASNEPPAKIIIDAPGRRGAVARRAVHSISHREPAHCAGLWTVGARRGSRIGHIHVTVDDAAWHWADASGNPVIINGLAPGPHTVLIRTGQCQPSTD